MVHPSQRHADSERDVHLDVEEARGLVTCALGDGRNAFLLAALSPRESALVALLAQFVIHVAQQSRRPGTEEEIWARFCLSQETH